MYTLDMTELHRIPLGSMSCLESAHQIGVPLDRLVQRALAFLEHELRREAERCEGTEAIGSRNESSDCRQ